MSTPTSSDDGLSAFEKFDRAMGAESCRTPYPEFAAMRAEGPVVKRASMGGEGPDLYHAVSHAAVAAVLRDGATFSSSVYRESMGLVMGPNILVMDGREHSQYRALIQKALSKKALARWEQDWVRPVVVSLVEGFKDRGRAELVRELMFPFPIQIIAGMLGLPERDVPEFHRLAVDLISVAFDWERGLAGSKALADYLTPLIEARRQDPGDDLISQLVLGEVDGKPIDNAHVLGFLRLLLPAGAETTYRSTSNLVFALLTHPDQFTALRANRDLLDAAIEEGLRWEVPLTGITRRCTRETVVEGVTIPEDALVQVVIGSANHDEARFENPEEFDLHRPPRQHMSFAFGPHRCVGMHLAHMEMRVVMTEILDSLPNLRLDPEAEDVHITGDAFRAPRTLPVLFDPPT